MNTSRPCRCGHSGNGPHPCHARGYDCKKPAVHRFYDAMPAHLAGVQVKFTARDTWACDACWLDFNTPKGE